MSTCPRVEFLDDGRCNTCGGAGKAEHFARALEIQNVQAAATANLFNFIGDGLIAARVSLHNQNVNLAS